MTSFNINIEEIKWKEGKLKNIVHNMDSGVSVNGADRPASEGERGVLKVSAVSYGVFDASANKVIIGAEIERARVNPTRGSIIISRANTSELVGASAYVEQDYPDMFLPDKLWQIRQESSDADNKWLSYFLSLDKTRKIIGSRATGTSSGMKNISQDAFLSIPILIPPLLEQRRVASILSQWDDSLSILSQLIDAKRQQKRGLAEQLLTGKRRLPGFEGEWDEATMGTVFSRVTRKNTEGNDHALTISGVHGLIDQREFFNKRVAANDLSGYYLLRRGEFAYNKSYSTGYDYGAIKRLNRYDAGVVSTLYICFALKREDAVSDFYEHFFEANLLNEGISGIAQEGARNHGLLNVSVVDFFELPLPFPPPSEQQAIAAVLSTMDTEIASLEALKAKVAEQKRGLMDALLTGRVRVKVEDD